MRKLNILLATYSYYPYNYGGTEVYVSGLASFLNKRGHSVTIIAGMPPEAFGDHPIFYEDQQLKTIEYYQRSIRVVGVVLKDQTTVEIYKKFRKEWVSSWTYVLNKLSNEFWDVLHIHANTSAIGEALIKATKLHSQNLKVIASYHVPVSCVKGTLLFANSLKACIVKPSGKICTACFISSKKNWPLSLSEKIAALMPSLQNKKLPTQLRLKFLVDEFIKSFNSFDKEIDQWHVFSEQIETIMQLNKIKKNKILLLRHGVNPFFFDDNIESLLNRQNKKCNIFLYAGRFDKVKGFFTLVKAWCSLPESSHRELWIIGERQTEDALMDKWLSTASQRKDIKWIGVQSQKSIAAITKQVHCIIIPSECVEIGPLVFHEAIASGCNVIASDIGGCKELSVLYNKKSTLFKTGNCKSLQKAIDNFTYINVQYHPLSQNENYSEVLRQYEFLSLS